MKKQIYFLGASMCLFLFSSLQSFAQDEDPWIVEIITNHWNMENEDFDYDEWEAMETEYHEKVTMKNEYVQGAEVLLHSYSPDNSEILFVKAYASWEDIDKAADKDWELIKAAWPDSAERMANFLKMNANYSGVHSDELYSTLTLPKFIENRNDTASLVFYFRKSHNVNPRDVEGGSGKEKMALRKEFLENVTHKDESVLGYYPMRHLYGSDSRDLLEVYIHESLSAMVEDDNTRDLVMAHWPEKEAREAFFKKLNQYRSPWHGDWVYTNIPALHK